MVTYLTNPDELDAIVRLRRRDVIELLRERLEQASGLHPRTREILEDVERYFENQHFHFDYLENYLAEAMPQVEEEAPVEEPVEEPVEIVLPVQDDEDAALVVFEQDVPEVVLDEDDDEAATQGEVTEPEVEEPAEEEAEAEEPEAAPQLEVREIDVLTPEERARRVSQRGLIREVRSIDRVKRPTNGRQR